MHYEQLTTDAESDKDQFKTLTNFTSPSRGVYNRDFRKKEQNRLLSFDTR